MVLLLIIVWKILSAIVVTMADVNESVDILRCPITLDLFRDPVLAQDGHTYERTAIEQWIRRNGTSPLTRQPLAIEHIYPNYKVKQILDTFETLMHSKSYQFTLNVDVKKKLGRPMFQTFGKTIYSAEWLLNSPNRPKIVLLKIDGARARKEASFYVDLSRHPNIIRTFGFVYDKDSTDQNNAVLLLQECAPEGSLYELLRERKTAPDEKILVRMFLQITEAMIYLTSNDCIHGDLACRNILVFRFDENQPTNNVVKIADFGLSRHSQLYSMTPGAAHTTLNIVPIRYAAPEVLASSATPDVYTEKSDIYSMGVLMWEAYSRGSMPWSNIPRDEDVIQKVIRASLGGSPTSSHATHLNVASNQSSPKSPEKQSKQEEAFTKSINCPHCKRSVNIDDHIPGKIIRHVHENCKKTFQQLNCPHCSGSL
ncbi:unnamed protein product, partial [Didymodactylos carnosus]